jgi:hypothetical protein
MDAKDKLILIESMTKSITIPIKLAEAYSSLVNTIGISLTSASLKIPPPTAVSTPAKDIVRKFRPKILYAKAEPITVKTPRPTASNFKNKFQCVFNIG